MNMTMREGDMYVCIRGGQLLFDNFYINLYFLFNS